MTHEDKTRFENEAENIAKRLATYTYESDVVSEGKKEISEALQRAYRDGLESAAKVVGMDVICPEENKLRKKIAAKIRGLKK